MGEKVKLPATRKEVEDGKVVFHVDCGGQIIRSTYAMTYGCNKCSKTFTSLWVLSHTYPSSILEGFEREADAQDVVWKLVEVQSGKVLYTTVKPFRIEEGEDQLSFLGLPTYSP